MKKNIALIFLFLIVISMGIVIIRNDKKIEPILLSINETYSYSYKDEEISLSLFTNYKNTIYNLKKEIDYIQLHSMDKSFSYDVELKKIEQGHSEKYLKANYYKFNYIFEKPDLNFNLSISDFYITIYTFKRDPETIKMGELYINNTKYKDDMIYDTLEGVTNTNILRISEVLITLDSEIEIVDIYLFDESLAYLLEDNKLTIFIPYKKSILVYFPIYLKINNKGLEDTILINSHKYITSFEYINKSEGLVNIYDIS